MPNQLHQQLPLLITRLAMSGPPRSHLKPGYCPLHLPLRATSQTKCEAIPLVMVPIMHGGNQLPATERWNHETHQEDLRIGDIRSQSEIKIRQVFQRWGQVYNSSYVQIRSVINKVLSGIRMPQRLAAPKLPKSKSIESHPLHPSSMPMPILQFTIPLT